MNTTQNNLSLTERLTQFRSRHPIRHIRVGEMEWEYISCGSGSKTLLLLTGGMRIAEAAFVLIQALEEEYRVVAPSYPPVKTVAELTDGLAAILDAEKAPTATIFGESYGGWIGQLLLRQHPKRFDKMVIASSGPLTASNKEKKMLGPVIALLRLLPENTIRGLLKRSFKSEIAFPEAEQSFWLNYAFELFDRLTKADFLSHFQLAQDAVRRKYDYAEGETSAWKGQILVIGAADDPAVSEEDRRRLMEIYPHVRAMTLKEGGHIAILSQPTAFVATVKEFLTND